MERRRRARQWRPTIPTDRRENAMERAARASSSAGAGGRAASALLVTGIVLVGLLARAPGTSAGEETMIPSREQREAKLAWWRDAKFGLFIHWGPASVIGK